MVIAPFRFSDLDLWKGRPVLVVSRRDDHDQTGHLIVLMITGARNSQWRDDITIVSWERAGLKRPSTIRFRLASVAMVAVADRLGTVDDWTLDRVSETLTRLII
ncbi:MAG: type II toxin-antitoxin system PemK/MazF family toxin [Sphingomonadaceae bacterium]